MHGILLGLRNLFADRRGAIGVLAAFVMVGVIGVSALALEYGHGLLQKTENQRVADLAAYAGALVYGATGSSTDATSAATNVAALNGFSSGATPTVVSSPTGDGNNAVQVTVTSSVPLLLARVLTANTTLPVSATAYAEVKSDAPGCIIALSGSGTGVNLSGGTAITADNCAVASNNAVTLSGGTTITTKNVDYGTSYSTSGGSSIVPPSGTASVIYSKVTTADPLGASSGSPGSTEVTNATARISSVSSIASPALSSVPSGGDISFGWSQSATQAQATADGCSATWNSSTSTWTLTCAGTGKFYFGNITLGGGINLNFNVSGGGTYDFSGSITTAAATTFGPGTYNIAGGITTAGITSFGAGTFNIGKGAGSCGGSTGYSICTGGGSNLTFGGPSTFVLAGGVYNGGGSTLTMGSGSTNSYDIGAATDGNSINAGTSKSTTLADAIGTNTVTCGSSTSTFCLAGNIASGGGTCMRIPAASEHDVNGYISLAGGTTLGAGVYTVSKYVAFGSSGGGAVSCGGSEVGVIGSGVTFVVGGSKTPSSGTCSGQAFCAAAGYDDVTLTAPASGSTTANLVVIGPTSSGNTAGATFAEGANNVNLSGAFYFPHGPVSLSGAGTINNGGGCLELVGSQVTLAGGSAATSTCSGLSGSSLGTTVTMVQ